MKRINTPYMAFAGIVWWLVFAVTVPYAAVAKGIKTSYKHYTLHTLDGRDFLCEPYTVKKDDWLYKIFRQKGEISERDFPLFIRIFKQINPHIHNIDTIPSGSQIMIPLKAVDRKTYTQDDSGGIDVPVVEFSDTTSAFDLSPHVHKHIVQTGDTVSDLLDKTFLKKGGGITQQGRILFYRLNPDVPDINQIYRGSRIVLPRPSILEQPWLHTYLVHGRSYAVLHPSSGPGTVSSAVPTVSSDGALSPPPPLTRRQTRQLARYARQVNGEFSHRGELFFPSPPGEKDTRLDLSRTPLIETQDPLKKILVIPRRPSGGQVLDDRLIERMREYWQQLEITDIESLIQKIGGTVRKSVTGPDTIKDRISDILAPGEETFQDTKSLSFTLNGIPVTVTLSCVCHPDRSDLLLNFGTVYGQGVNALKESGHHVLSLPPGLSWKDQVQGLLSELGYTIWENPPFHHDGKVTVLQGLYAERLPDRVFISQRPVTDRAGTFLKNSRIRIVCLEPEMP